MLRYRRRLLHLPPKSFFSGTFGLGTRLLHQLPVLNRSVDKVHRKLINSLYREVRKYKEDRPITLEPTIQHFLVQLELCQHKKFDVFNVTSKVIPTPFKVNKLVEPLMFHILSLIVANSNAIQMDVKTTSTIHDNISVILSHIPYDSNKLSNSCVDLTQLAHQLFFLLPFEHNINEDCMKSMITALEVLLNISHGINLENFDLHLLKWSRSILSGNVTSACTSLTNLIDIPGFVVGDILLRTPMSKQELHLQLDLWQNFKHSIRVSYHEKVGHLRMILNNLIFYTVHLDIEKLPGFITETCAFFTNPRASHHTKLFTNDYINKLMWKVPFYYVESAMTKNSSADMVMVIKAQETMSKYLGRTQGSPDLSLEGSMGVVLAISHMSFSKARSLFNISRDKHFTRRHHLQRKELLSFNFVRIMISETPDELLNAFNEAATDSKHVSTIWLGFIKKLLSFELLTPQRSEQVLEKLLDISDDILMTKNIILHLMVPLTSNNHFETFVKRMNQHGNWVVPKFRSILIEKYMIVLYNNLQAPVDPEIFRILIPDKHMPPSLSESDGLTIARDLYYNHITRKTPSVIGKMMNGEVKVQLENLYNIYKQELTTHETLPDESCLMALLKASMTLTTGDINSGYIWDGMYAPQVAVHEFKTHVKSGDVVFPNDELWQNYILLLHKFGYISQLSEIMEWWVDLKFNPSYETLLLLLKSLPIEFAERHILHISKVKSDATTDTRLKIIGNNGSHNWPWPSIDDLHT